MKEYPTLQSVKDQFLCVTKIINLQLSGKELNRRILQRVLRTAKTNPNHVFATLYLFAALQRSHHHSQRVQLYDALVYRLTGIPRKDFFLVQYLLGAGDQLLVAVCRMILFAWSQKGEDFRQFGLEPNWWVYEHDVEELALASFKLVQRHGFHQYFRTTAKACGSLHEHNKHRIKKRKQEIKKQKNKKRQFLRSVA